MSTAADALARLVEGIDRERLGAYGAVVRIGDDDAAHRWRSDDPENLASVSKGVCALAVGIAVDEGILHLGTRVPELLPGLDLRPGVDEVTVEHLLTMTSGVDFAWFGAEPVPGPDLAQAMLARPRAAESSSTATPAPPSPCGCSPPRSVTCATGSSRASSNRSASTTLSGTAARSASSRAAAASSSAPASSRASADCCATAARGTAGSS